MKPLQFLWRIALVFVSISFFWSIGFTLMSWISGSHDKQAVWEHNLASGTQAAAAIGKDPAAADDLLQQLGQLLVADVALIGDTAEARPAGSAKAAALAADLPQHAVDSVLRGDTYTSHSRWNPFRDGQATTGQRIELNGRPAALFIRTEIPSVFSGYARQLAALNIGFLFLFGTMALIGSLSNKARRDGFHLMIEATRRIAKGDFNINLDASPMKHGPFGELAQSLNHMAGELSEMEKMRQEFISNVSHEIQSPLTSISGFSRALQNDDIGREERLQILGIIETESKRLSKLSDNLLKLTSLESSHHPFEPKRYRLDKQLRTLVLACEPQWVGKNIDMDVSLDEVAVVLDEDSMSQVWINLLGNSIKFVPEGGTIGLILRQVGDRAIVSISDNGPGIGEEDLPFVFDRFFKADKSRNRTSGGSGLGLSIVKKIVEMHHGTVAVVSKPGHGATFTVTLPLQPT